MSNKQEKYLLQKLINWKGDNEHDFDTIKKNERKEMQSFKYLEDFEKREPESAVYYRKSKVDYSALIEKQKERRMDK